MNKDVYMTVSTAAVWCMLPNKCMKYCNLKDCLCLPFLTVNLYLCSSALSVGR